METMRFREHKKSSYKIQIFAILLFFILGGGIIYFAISNEDEPTLIGQNKSDIQKSANIEEKNALIDVPAENTSKLFKISNKYISDKTNKKIKANITLPVISVNNEILTSMNDEIFKKYNDTYLNFKETMANGQNKFTYTVTYKVYDNIIANKNILTITIYERIIDDSSKTNSMEKIYTYNIDLKDCKILNQKDVIVDILGSTYKDKIKQNLEEYLISKKMINKDEYTYSYTGLENFYINEKQLHLIFNPGEIADKKYSILDIIIK
ncbi:MAG: hypothetical protein RR144_05830 [Clostridia bacterium]